MGMAIRGSNAEVNYYVEDGDKIVAVAYSLPFFLVLLLLMIIFPIVWCCVPWEEVEKPIKASPRWQANIVATLLLCGMFCIYTFIMDIVSWVRENDVNSLPSYYKEIKHFVNLTRAYFFLYSLFFIILILEAIVCKIIYDKKIRQNSLNSEETKKYTGVIIYIVFSIVGSTLLSITAHFPSILMAWATDPFYAYKIGLFYVLTIGTYFTAFHFAYIFSRKCFYNDGDFKCFIAMTVLLIIVSFIFVSGIVVILSLFVVTVPVSNSIETAAEGVNTIYNGAVILIGALLAYRIGWHHIGNSFSISDALKKAMDNVKYPDTERPQQQPDTERLRQQPDTERPRQQPDTERPRQQPDTERPRQQPDTERPRQQPDTERPRQQPDTERPRQQPDTERPRQQPDTERPRQQPDTERPRQQPDTERPRQQPDTERPRQQPDTERPRQQPDTERPRQQPDTERPRQQPDPKAEWEKLTEEGKLTKVMKAIIQHKVEKHKNILFPELAPAN